MAAKPNNGHGGYRRPSRPAPVSGPGAHSKRTDGGVTKMQLPDARYGEQRDFQEAQSAAPLNAPKTAMAQTFPGPAAQGPDIAGMLAGLTPLDAPTERPDEPVTAGANAGPGPDQRGIGIAPPNMAEADVEAIRSALPALMEMAARPNATPSFRSYVRLLRSKAI